MDVLRGTREYTQKQKTKVRKSGRSILRKVEQLGVGGEVLTVVVFRDPLSGDFCVGGHVPEGETAPDLNLLFKAHMNEPQEYLAPRRRPNRNAPRRRSNRKATQRITNLSNAKQITTEENRSPESTSDRRTPPTDNYQLGSQPDTGDVSNQTGTQCSEALSPMYQLDVIHDDYAENDIYHLEGDVTVLPAGELAETHQDGALHEVDTIHVRDPNQGSCISEMLWEDGHMEATEATGPALVPGNARRTQARVISLVLSKYLDNARRIRARAVSLVLSRYLENMTLND